MVCVVGGLAGLDARRVRLHRLSADHQADRRRIPGSDDRSHDRLHADLVDAAGRRRRIGLARRPYRPQDAADDLDLLVLDLQFHRGLLADFSLPADLPYPPRHRHGRGMAGRRGVLQGSWSIGFLLSSVIYGLFYDYIGWRGMLWIGVLPALSIVWIRYYVKEPPVWVENRRQQRAEKREVRAPLIKIFQRGMIANTLLACWWMASNFVLYYSIWALFATHLQADLKLTTMGTAVPFMVANILSFLGMSFWGWTADFIGRRWAMMIPAAIAIPIAPMYLFTSDPFWITVGFGLQGAFGGALYSQLPAYMSERFPTEVRATSSAFCYHQGAILGGLVAPVLAYFATTYDVGYAVPMLVGTVVAAFSVVVALLLSPETKGKELVADLVVA